MKENTFTEKESLELITQMIQQTRQKLQVGSGNVLLYYGYTSVIIAIAVYALCHVTGHMYWHNLWFLMLVPMMTERYARKRRQPAVITYLDKAVNNIWNVINALLVLTVLTILAMGFFTPFIPMVAMMPFALLYVGIGTACTGVITNEKSMTYFPVISLVISIYMLVILITEGRFTLTWNLLAGLSFFLMLIIPGHILNRKSLKLCSKN